MGLLIRLCFFFSSVAPRKFYPTKLYLKEVNNILLIQVW
jgi:hypothetical protein